MESEDDKKLVHEESEYRIWLQTEGFRRDKHVCLDVPPEKEETDFDKLMKAAMHGCTKCLDKLIKAGASSEQNWGIQDHYTDVGI